MAEDINFPPSLEFTVPLGRTLPGQHWHAVPTQDTELGTGLVSPMCIFFSKSSKDLASQLLYL